MWDFNLFPIFKEKFQTNAQETVLFPNGALLMAFIIGRTQRKPKSQKRITTSWSATKKLSTQFWATRLKTSISRRWKRRTSFYSSLIVPEELEFLKRLTGDCPKNKCFKKVTLSSEIVICFKRFLSVIDLVCYVCPWNANTVPNLSSLLF